MKRKTNIQEVVWFESFSGTDLADRITEESHRREMAISKIDIRIVTSGNNKYYALVVFEGVK